jgi:thiamine kinase-like enzyme
MSTAANKSMAGLGVKEVKRLVAAFFKTTVSGIVDWKKLEGSHYVYYFCVNGEKYIVRWFKDTNSRQVKAEKAAYAAIQSLGVSDEVLYFDEAGVKIARYLDGKTLNTGKRDHADTLALLRKIHQSGIVIPGRYNIFTMIADYSTKLRSKNPAKAEVLRQYQKDINAIKAAFDTLNVTPVLCQGDACAINFLRLKDGSLRLLDWEQALMADPFLDLAIAALNQKFDKARIAWGLAQYLQREPDAQETYRMNACIALGGFMLAVWAAGEHYDDCFKYYLDKAVEAIGRGCVRARNTLKTG